MDEVTPAGPFALPGRDVGWCPRQDPSERAKDRRPERAANLLPHGDVVSSCVVLVIRESQIQALSIRRTQEFTARMLCHIGAHYGERARALEPAALLVRVETALDEARGHGLKTERSLYQYMNLCMSFGWTYLDEPENAWMRERYLSNTALGSPESRLRLLADEVLRRMEVDEHNAQLRDDR